MNETAEMKLDIEPKTHLPRLSWHQESLRASSHLLSSLFSLLSLMRCDTQPQGCCLYIHRIPFVLHDGICWVVFLTLNELLLFTQEQKVYTLLDSACDTY